MKLRRWESIRTLLPTGEVTVMSRHFTEKAARRFALGVYAKALRMGASLQYHELGARRRP